MRYILLLGCVLGAVVMTPGGTPAGRAVALINTGWEFVADNPVRGGKAILEARNQDFKGSYLTIFEE